MTIFRDYAPAHYMDVAQILSGNLIDDVSGKKWGVRGTLKKSTDLYGAPSCYFDGSSTALDLETNWNSTSWSVAVFIRNKKPNSLGRFWSVMDGTSVTSMNSFADAIIDGSRTLFRVLGVNGEGNNESNFAILRGELLETNCVIVTYESKTLDVWVNGVKTASLLAQYQLTGSALKFAVGALPADNSNYFFKGDMSDLAQYNRALSDVEITEIWNRIKPSSIVFDRYDQIKLNNQPTTFNGGFLLPAGFAQNGSGNGSLQGTVKIQVSPTKQEPACRKVRIFDTTTGKLIAETWSDAKTGAWRVDGLALDRLFTVLSHDHEKEFNAVTADYRYAEVL